MVVVSSLHANPCTLDAGDHSDVFGSAFRGFHAVDESYLRPLHRPQNLAPVLSPLFPPRNPLHNLLVLIANILCWIPQLTDSAAGKKKTFCGRPALLRRPGTMIQSAFPSRKDFQKSYSKAKYPFSWPSSVPTLIPHRFRRKLRSRLRSRQSPSSNLASLETSFSPADTLRSLRAHRWSFYDGQYLFLIILAVFSLSITPTPGPLAKTLIATLIMVSFILPVTRQFCLPFAFIACWLYFWVACG